MGTDIVTIFVIIRFVFVNQITFTINEQIQSKGERKRKMIYGLCYKYYDKELIILLNVIYFNNVLVIITKLCISSGCISKSLFYDF